MECFIWNNPKEIKFFNGNRAGLVEQRWKGLQREEDGVIIKIRIVPGEVQEQNDNFNRTLVKDIPSEEWNSLRKENDAIC